MGRLAPRQSASHHAHCETEMKFGELACECCSISGSIVAMHRVNPKGETGRWRCESCLDTPADPAVLAVTDFYTIKNMEARL